MADLDLSASIGAVRDQGLRQTCLSFACSDAHARSISYPGFLSPESLHQQAAAHAAASTDDAISPASAQAVLERSGQTSEIAWPYGSPKAGDHAAVFYRVRTSFAVFSVATVLKELHAGRPVVVALDIGAEFYDKGDSLSGELIHPREAVHAVVISGARVLEGGVSFKLRNSWGPGWGVGGYKWAAEAYLSKRSVLTMIFEGAP